LKKLAEMIPVHAAAAENIKNDAEHEEQTGKDWFSSSKPAKLTVADKTRLKRLIFQITGIFEYNYIFKGTPVRVFLFFYMYKISLVETIHRSGTNIPVGGQDKEV